jgi:hypothetical protein
VGAVEQTGAAADGDVSVDEGVRADLDVVGELGVRVNIGTGVNFRHNGLL